MSRSDDCAGISDTLPEFLAGRVSAEDDARIRKHLERCADCRNRANAVSLLQQTPVPVPDPEKWGMFVQGVVAATEQRPGTSLRSRAFVAAAAVVVIAGGVYLWAYLGPQRASADDLEGLARDVAELSEEEAAVWTAGLGRAGWPAPGFDTAGLTEEELQQLATEVERT